MALASTDSQIDSLSIDGTHECYKETTGQSAPALLAELSDGKFDHLTTEQCFELIRDSASYSATCASCAPGQGALIFLSDTLAKQNNTLLYGVWMDPSIMSSNIPLQNLSIYAWPGEITTWDVIAPVPEGTISFNIGNFTSIDKFADYPNLHNDLRVLYDYLLKVAERENTTDADSVRAYLSDPTVWKNKIWAANVKLEPDDICSLGLMRDASEASASFDYKSISSSYQVDGCLSQIIPEKCEVLLCPPICLVVIGCSFVKVICMLLICRDKRKRILLTVGDAIASFLERPDPTTTDRCSMQSPNEWQWPLYRKRRSSQNLPRCFEDCGTRCVDRRLRPGRWMHAATSYHWAAMVFLYVALPDTLAIASAMY